MPGFDPVWIVVVVLLAEKVVIPALRQRKQFGSNLALRTTLAQAIRDRVGDCSEDSVTRQSNAHLLIRGKNAHRKPRIRDAADNLTAIVAPGPGNPLPVLVLVAEHRCGLEGLVVVDTEDTTRQLRPVRHQAAHFRRIKSSPVMPEGPVGLESLEIGGADTARNAV